MAALAWLLTYLVHSTLLLAGAWLASRWLRGRLEPIGEVVWKCALVGGLFTASLQTVVGLPSYGGRWELAAAPSTRALPGRSTNTREAWAPPLEPGREVASGSPRQESRPVEFPLTNNSDRSLAMASGIDAQRSPRPEGTDSRQPRAWIIAELLLAISALGLLRLTWAQIRLGRGRRSPITSGPLFGRLRLLRQRAGVRQAVRLTRSNRFPVPMALGVLRKEICVPARALSDLSGAQQDTMLAHELAHLLRRDPLWLALASALEKVFWFQPLNRVARLHLQESAEFACDAWAAEQTQGHLPLASCLTEVAGWTVSACAPPETACAVLMAGSPSTLGRRIARLLQPEQSLPESTLACWRWIAPLVLLAGGTAIAPAVSAGSQPATPVLTSDPAVSGTRLAPTVLPLADALTALQQEIASLRSEVALLRLELGEGPALDSASALLDQLIRQANELQARGAELRTRGQTLPFTLQSQTR